MIENFTDSDTTPLATHDSNWTHSWGDGISNLTINSNQLRVTAYRSEVAYYSGSATDYAKATVLAGMDDNNRCGPVVRISGSNQGYACYLDVLDGGSNFTLVRILRDGTLIDSKSCSAAQASNHILAIKATGTGATVTVEVWLDGSSLGTYGDTDAGRLLSGSCGLYVYEAVGSAVNMLDDWTDQESGGFTAKSRRGFSVRVGSRF